MAPHNPTFYDVILTSTMEDTDGNNSLSIGNITCDHPYAIVFGLNCSEEPDHEGTDFLISSPGLQALFYMLYTIIFVVGVFGNVLVCYVVIRNKTMQTVTNFFITNLALSDILLCVLAVPFTPLYSFLKNWVFGGVLCHMLSYAQGVSVYISTLTLMSIAIDRFFVIVYPFKPRMKISTCLVIISSIWTFAIFATLPYGIFMELLEEEGKTYCTEQWPNEKSRHIFSGCTTVLQFIVPFIIITFCYVRVSIKLRDRARAKPGAKSSKKEEADRERKRRTNRMLIAMVAIFGCSWLPLNLVNLVSDLSIEIVYWPYYHLFFFIAHSIAMSSTCYNPFLYAWLNENFRKEFKQVLPGFGREDDHVTRRRMGGRGSTFRAERSCNGNNETVQELLPIDNSIRVPNNAPGGEKVLYVANTNQVQLKVLQNAKNESQSSVTANSEK